ncbi:GIY-YIG nuclease family protein [Liquorilactobacillus mali]|uniref:GIY-YIG nuclease family protein n=1 Tax=Liquorilactobacillus mali TaxID=1618 RepID=A0A0R2FRU4_9LACO|nr:GIY-YIG nuclease family protein [Liquorilactobacillus mali]KRN31137.1 hypothetical protein IV36_GL001946 [Liquorilactobacillus mali]
MKTELWNGYQIRFVEKMGYRFGSEVFLKDPYVERLNINDGKFLLTQSGDVYYETDIFDCDNGTILVPDVVIELGDYLDKLGKIKSKFIFALNSGLSKLSFSFFPKKHPSEISLLAEKIANLSDFDNYFLNNCNFTKRLNKVTSQGYVYFLKSKNGLVKIGCTSNLGRRIKAIQAMNPEKLVLIGKIKTSKWYQLENEIHNFFKKYLIHGEWYDIKENNLMALQDKYGLNVSISETIYNSDKQLVTE